MATVLEDHVRVERAGHLQNRTNTLEAELSLASSEQTNAGVNGIRVAKWFGKSWTAQAFLKRHRLSPAKNCFFAKFIAWTSSVWQRYLLAK